MKTSTMTVDDDDEVQSPDLRPRCEGCNTPVKYRATLLCSACVRSRKWQQIGGMSHGDSRYGLGEDKALRNLRRSLKESKRQIAERRTCKP